MDAAPLTLFYEISLKGGSHVQPGYEWQGLYKGQITLTFGCIVFASFLVPRFFCKIENESFLNKLKFCEVSQNAKSHIL